MIHFNVATMIALAISAAGCASTDSSAGYGMSSTGSVRTAGVSAKAPPMDATRKIAEQDCSKAVDFEGGNLRCR